MLKHYKFQFDSDSVLKELNFGRKYYLNYENVRYRDYTFNTQLINNDLDIKITIYGLEPKQSIKLILNNETYIYTSNHNSNEFNFKYEKYSSDIFHFESDEEIWEAIIGEVVVGILPKNIPKMFKQINFEDILGNLTLQAKEGIVIKMPKNFSEDFYDFSIISP